MSVVDQSRDPVMAHLMRRVADRPKLAAALADVDVRAEELANLPDTAFAWPEKRAYPVHTAGHTLMSRVYREGVENVPPHVDRALKEACEVFGVDDGVLARPKVAAAQESADAFLLPEQRRLRVTEAAHVKTAQARLLDEGKVLGVVGRALAASRLVEKAAFFGVNVRPEVHQMAGNVATNTRLAADWIEARGAAAPIEYKDSFAKLAQTVRRMPGELHDRDQQVKVAQAVEQLDQLAGLDVHYGKRLPDPVLTVFNTTKRANWNQNGVTLAGQFMPLERLAAYEPTFYSDVLGPDIVREASDAAGRMDTSKLAQILETLPVDMQRALASQMR